VHLGYRWRGAPLQGLFFSLADRRPMKGWENVGRSPLLPPNEPWPPLPLFRFFTRLFYVTSLPLIRLYERFFPGPGPQRTALSNGLFVFPLRVGSMQLPNVMNPVQVRFSTLFFRVVTVLLLTSPSIFLGGFSPKPPSFFPSFQSLRNPARFSRSFSSVLRHPFLECFYPFSRLFGESPNDRQHHGFLSSNSLF